MMKVFISHINELKNGKIPLVGMFGNYNNGTLVFDLKERNSFGL